jgi:hypothetical protein
MRHGKMSRFPLSSGTGGLRRFLFQGGFGAFDLNVVSGSLTRGSQQKEVIQSS